MYYFVDTWSIFTRKKKDTWSILLSHKVSRSSCCTRLLTSTPLLFSLLFSFFQLSKNIIFKVLQPAYITLLYLLSRVISVGRLISWFAHLPSLSRNLSLICAPYFSILSSQHHPCSRSFILLLAMTPLATRSCENRRNDTEATIKAVEGSRVPKRSSCQ
jgi:hypothetical protein